MNDDNKEDIKDQLTVINNTLATYGEGMVNLIHCQDKIESRLKRIEHNDAKREALNHYWSKIAYEHKLLKKLNYSCGKLGTDKFNEFNPNAKDAEQN